MNILLAGGSGFVGRSLITQLSTKHSIMAPSSSELDLTSLADLGAFMLQHECQFIINCAVHGGRRTKVDTAVDFYNNVKILDNLLHFVNEDRKLITFSSGAELHAPETYYGFSKKICSSLVRGRANVKNLRVYNVFGELGMEDSFVYSAIKRCLLGEDIVIWDDKLFDVCYVNDVIQLIDRLIETDSPSYQEIDCVYEKKYKLSELASLIKSLTHSSSRIIVQADTGSKYTGTCTFDMADPTPLTVSLQRMIDHLS